MWLPRFFSKGKTQKARESEAELARARAKHAAASEALRKAIAADPAFQAIQAIVRGQ